MNRILISIVISCAAICITACNTTNNQEVSTVTGGVVGSTVGNGNGRLVATAAGTSAGVILGGAVSHHMDENDKAHMSAALENNNVGQPTYWNNAKSDTHYQVTPVKNVTVHGNKYCREYRTTADIAGKQQQVYGKACRQPDGTWKAVS